jgi:hypothetical protein
MLKLWLYVMCLCANQTTIWLTIMIDQSNGKLSLLNSVCRQQWEVGISHLLSLTSYHLLLVDVDSHPHLFDNVHRYQSHMSSPWLYLIQHRHSSLLLQHTPVIPSHYLTQYHQADWVWLYTTSKRGCLVGAWWRMTRFTQPCVHTDTLSVILSALYL